VNGLKIMREAVVGWKDIESYAADHQWEGSFEVPMVAAAVVGLKKEGRLVEKVDNHVVIHWAI
jgi:hypothetical protein